MQCLIMWLVFIQWKKSQWVNGSTYISKEFSILGISEQTVVVVITQINQGSFISHFLNQSCI